MQAIRKYTPFFTSALLMYVLLFFIYPHYQYYIDPDGVSYLTISKRYAAGDFQKAVNGYWSPWSCWLTALLIKGGIEAIPASVIINTIGATGFLFISQSFFLRVNIINKLQWLLNITLALFLSYAIFGQSFDDLWECFFLLATLRLMLADNFVKKPVLWIASGVIGALAYFAKAYSFPFFILNTVCCVYFICKDNKAQWLKISLTSIITMFVCSLPWIMALHNKYGIWATSTAGPLNMSWYLVGHPHWKEGVDLLIPPAYPDSPYYWEDPWFANGDTPHFWNSWQLFGRQLLKIIHNLYKLLVSMVQLSVFFPLITVVLIRFVSNNKARVTTAPAFIVALSFLIFPLGYVLINFEARYIWYMLPLSMLAGSLFIQNHLSGKSYSRILPLVFSIGFLIYPAWNMVIMFHLGKDEYDIAKKIKLADIHGSFTGNIHPRFMSRLALLYRPEKSLHLKSVNYEKRQSIKWS
ncbi:MAG: hypothetical protein ACHQD8_07390 [Chitinophagales bacterium]